MKEKLDPLWSEIETLRLEVRRLIGESLLWRALAVSILQDAIKNEPEQALRLKRIMGEVARGLEKTGPRLDSFHPHSISWSEETLAFLRSFLR